MNRNDVKVLGIYVLVIFTSCILIGSVAQAQVNNKRVLVLNSYHPGFAWSDSIMAGIRSVLKKADLNVELTFEYMDTKHHPSEEIFPVLEKFYIVKYHDHRFDVIIVSDNNGLNFLLERRDKIFPGVPIVFCGINNYSDSLIEGHLGITGVAEDFDLKGTIQLILRLHPRTNQIAVITDATYSGAINLGRIRTIMPEFNNAVEFIELANLTATELKDALHHLPDNTVILYLAFYRDWEGRTFSTEESVSLIVENSDLPIYSVWDYMIVHGVLGGVVTSGQMQGQNAGHMALRILQGEPADDIPILKESPNTPMFDYTQLKDYGLSFPDLPVGSVVLNEPESFYYRYRLVIWGIFAFVLFQSLTIAALVINNTQRKRAEKSLIQEQNLLQALMDNIPDHIYFKDTESRFIRTNKATDDWFNLSDPEQVLGKTDFDFFTEEHARQAYEDEQQIMQSSEPLVGIVEKETWPDGREKTWVSTTKLPLRDEEGRIVGIMGISRDITELKRSEEEIRDLNEELEQRVEDRTRELKAANNALQESLDTLKKTQALLVQTEKMAALGRLVAGVTHEISTPIGVGVTAASHLEEKTQEFAQHYRKSDVKHSDLEKYLQVANESTGIILRNLRQASQHIQSFKLVAVDQTSGEKRGFMLKEYIEEVLLSLHPKFKHTKHTVTLNCPDDLELDSYPGAFSQIITNLVINSLTHGFDQKFQGEILLDFTTVNGTLWIKYSDNGRGMDEEELSRIFEPFYTTKRTQGGSGLGLHIVYNLITQRLNGHIECVSTSGNGTTFLIQLPVELPQVA